MNPQQQQQQGVLSPIVSSSGSSSLLASPVQSVDITAADALFFHPNPSPSASSLVLPAAALTPSSHYNLRRRRDSSGDNDMTSPTVLRTRVAQPERSLSSPSVKPERLESVFGPDFVGKYDISNYGKARRRRRRISLNDYLPGCTRSGGNFVTRMLDKTQSLHPKIHHAAHIAMNEPMRFSKFNLVHLLDVNVLALSPDEISFAPRTKIVEIVGADDVVFCLTQSGICLTFERETMNFLCKINSDAEEVIRSLFLNRKNDSLIIVSVHREDNFSSLKCKSIGLKDIREKHPEKGKVIFASESLKWPGFVEFDDVNGKVLTFSAETRQYKVWSLKEYNELFTLDHEEIEEIKISCGVMLLIFNKLKNKSYQYLPLKIVDIETGQELKMFKHLLKRNRKIDFIEQFNEKLLIKQEGEDLQILDVVSGEVVQVSTTNFLTPNAFIFLYEWQLFLTFKDREVLVWNFKGQCVTR
eukprot:TRINITY_DN4012_c0_g1_i1.p1 TRINITY_DN4012_c0_g1~~TRINITY_DN4012_c0_g1_i1.p1  ORF type:complete len:470 (+),score=112.87 TRINITY_DN4012_c0_g1_i1:215-1624(+)